MVNDHSKQALITFLEKEEKRGTLPATKTKVWLVAIRAMLTDLSPEEEADIRKLDIDSAFRRVLNKDPNKYGPATLAEYRNRILKAIGEFTKWASDPTSYKFVDPRPPRVGGERVRVKHAADSATGSENGAVADMPRAPSGEPAVAVSGSGLALPFPLRPNFLAQVVIPRDLKVDEARRLGAFLRTLAHDFSPAEE